MEKDEITGDDTRDRPGGTVPDSAVLRSLLSLLAPHPSGADAAESRKNPTPPPIGEGYRAGDLCRLLRALIPFLSPERRQAAERLIRILEIWETVAPLLQGDGR